MTLPRTIFAILAVASFELPLSTLACSSSGNEISDAGRGDAKSRDAAAKDVATDAPPPFEGGLPFLTDLRVSAPGSSPPVELVPSFSSGVFDYYVRCAEETNALSVSMTASPGATSQLTQPKKSSSQPTQTVALNVDENQAIVATASDAKGTTEYWVRCLPSDFPMLKMTIHAEAGTAPPGYYLVGNIHTLAGTQGYAMVLNGNGVPVWYYKQPDGDGVCDVDSVVNGGISYFPTNSGVSDISTVPLQVHELSPLKTVYAKPKGIVLDIHELRFLPGSGHYLVFGDPVTTGVDLTGLNLPLADGGAGAPLGPNSDISDCQIVEFDPATGDVSWQWLASDHFDAAKVSTLPEPEYGETGPMGGFVIDPFHCNSIDVDPANGNLLVSARQMNSVFYIEKSTGKVLWKMGGKDSSKDGATYVSVDDPFFCQHDARLQPGWSATCNGGSGQISLFDDQTLAPGPARAAVYSVVVGVGDGGTLGDGGCGDGGMPEAGAAGAATLAWQFKGAQSVDATGSFRILADGSRVIGWGSGTMVDLIFTEVDVGGHDLLDFYFEDGANWSYRSIKVPLTEFNLDALRRTAGRP